MHLYGQLKQVIKTLTLGFGLVNRLSPDIYTMPPNQNSIRVWILLHCFFQAFCQVFFMGSVLNHGNPQCVKVAQIGLPWSSSNALDLLNIIDFKHFGSIVPFEISL